MLIGEVFHDMYDFRSALKKILRNADIKKHYEPRKWVTSNYGNQNAVNIALSTNLTPCPPSRCDSDVGDGMSTQIFCATQGRRLLKFVKEEFPEWYKYIIPKGTTKLFI